MKAKAYISLWWGDEYGYPQKSPEELEHDKQRVKEILERMGYGREFEPERKLYKFELDVGSESLNTLLDVLRSDPHLAGPNTTVVRSYSRQELESAELLVWGPTNQAIEDDYYELYGKAEDKGFGKLYKRCPACGAPLQQTRALIVNKALMGKKDVSLTYSYEVILAERIGRLLQEHGLTGFELRPVRHFKRPYKGEPTLYQLVVTNVLPPMASPPTAFEGIKVCPACQRQSQLLKYTHWWGKIQYRDYTDEYYSRNVLEVAEDFNLTAEWLGERRVLGRAIIVRQRVYRLLREHKVKNWAALPVYLVD